MNQTLGMEATLLSAVHPHVSKHTSVYSILLSSVIALAGVASIVLAVQSDGLSATLSMALLTVGTILVLVALYRLFWKSTEVVYIPTGSIIKEGTCYVDSADLRELADMMAAKGFKCPRKVAFKSSGNGRMDYLVSKDGQFAAVQLFQFVPYNYEPATAVHYYVGDDAASFMRYLSL